MERYQIENIVDTIEALIEQKINGARPGHQKLANDPEDHKAELVRQLTEAFGDK